MAPRQRLGGLALAGKILAEYICEAGDGMTVNLLDRPAEQIGSLLDGAPNHAATVNTIRRGLREFGLSA